jgi:hypothetical protein
MLLLLVQGLTDTSTGTSTSTITRGLWGCGRAARAHVWFLGGDDDAGQPIVYRVVLSDQAVFLDHPLLPIHDLFHAILLDYLTG